ncbi:hypothetical protein V6N12_065179 [Hibiscus sabdariffa]|uniref:Uncharacterized protein n=1 Tax=Hibiscus sabdariffa TaxID=183260 RepID=A0ABR2G8T3_9ROSI
MDASGAVVGITSTPSVPIDTKRRVDTRFPTEVKTNKFMDYVVASAIPLTKAFTSSFLEMEKITARVRTINLDTVFLGTRGKRKYSNPLGPTQQEIEVLASTAIASLIESIYSGYDKSKSLTNFQSELMEILVSHLPKPSRKKGSDENEEAKKPITESKRETVKALKQVDKARYRAVKANKEVKESCTEA